MNPSAVEVGALKVGVLAVLKVGVMLWVAVKDPEVKVSVYAVPSVPLIPTSVKVATPATALTVVVPTVAPFPLTVIVTEAVLLVTVLPKASLILMMGWVVSQLQLSASP